jgi:hypothetical protein
MLFLHPTVLPDAARTHALPALRADLAAKREGETVSRDQIHNCAEKLPPVERIEFMCLQREADDAIRRGWEMRKRAWEIYRRARPAGNKRGAK